MSTKMIHICRLRCCTLSLLRGITVCGLQLVSIGKDDSCTKQIEKKREETSPQKRIYPREKGLQETTQGTKKPRELANKTKQKTAQIIITIFLATSPCKPKVLSVLLLKKEECPWCAEVTQVALGSVGTQAPPLLRAPLLVASGHGGLVVWCLWVMDFGVFGACLDTWSLEDVNR